MNALILLVIHLTPLQFWLEEIGSAIAIVLLCLGLSSVFPKPWNKWIFVGLLLAFFVGCVFGQEASPNPSEALTPAEKIQLSKDMITGTQKLMEDLKQDISEVESQISNITVLRRAGVSDEKIWDALTPEFTDISKVKAVYSGSIDKLLVNRTQVISDFKKDLIREDRTIKALANVIEANERLLSNEQQMSAADQAHQDAVSTRRAIEYSRVEADLNARIQQVSSLPKP